MQHVRLVGSLGSSPRMRGAPFSQESDGWVRGIIPAYAGSTAGTPSRRTDSEDHPRVCGEHCVNLLADYNAKGSSPRMRGALGRRPLWKVYPGIIPAYAGSTVLAGIRRLGARDHPRVCGEHPASAMRTIVQLGSSPRMRGALARMPALQARVRIIPAYAGSTQGR